ncbi:hypothetical protein GN956_G14723 [Arapaima gigas]
MYCNLIILVQIKLGSVQVSEDTLSSRAGPPERTRLTTPGHQQPLAGEWSRKQQQVHAQSTATGKDK